jgi:hypothetical protein
VETSHPKLIFGNIPAFGDGGEAHFGLGCFRSSESAKDVKNPGQSGVLAAADGSQSRMMFLNPRGDFLESGFNDWQTPACETSSSAEHRLPLVFRARQI